MKINVALYIKKLGKDYKEKIRETPKTKKLLLFSLRKTTCDFLFSAEKNVLIRHFVDIGQLL